MNSPPSRPVVLLGTDKASTRIVYHALRQAFPQLEVILEGRRSRTRTILRRRRLGTVSMLGQAAFAGLVVPILRWQAQKRIRQIIRDNRLDASPIPSPLMRVASVNSEACVLRLCSLKPAVVVVNGTRIIKRTVLDTVRAPFINIHAGITPLYRGGHGAYWALAEGQPTLVGTTIHLIDPGIDTGPVLAQATFRVTREDSFATYPYLHLAAGLPHLAEVVARALGGDLNPLSSPPSLASRLRYHPTAWGYLYRRLTRGVK